MSPEKEDVKNDTVLTYSSRLNGEQSTMVMGEGKKPSTQHLLKLGLEAKLSKKLIEEIIEQTKNALDKWKYLSKDYNIGKSPIEFILHSVNHE